MAWQELCCPSWSFPPISIHALNHGVLQSKLKRIDEQQKNRMRYIEQQTCVEVRNKQIE
jgi:hypothetical protein